MDRSGLFLAIEGTDEATTTKQFELLRDSLVEDGYEIASFEFPRLDQPSSHFVREYLAGRYGTPEEVGAYTTSQFYALDHHETAKRIRQALEQGKVVLVKHYAGSNMAEQGAKFEHPEERRGFFIWLDNLEFQMLKIPRPDKSLVLRVPITSSKLIEVYDDLCQLFPKDFVRIDAIRGDQPLDTETINKLLRETIQPLLPARSMSPKPSAQAVEPPQYTYYTPGILNKAAARLYTQKMDQILNLQAELYQKLTTHFKTDRSAEVTEALKQTLPVSIISPLTRYAFAKPYLKSPDHPLQDAAEVYLPDQLAPAASDLELLNYVPRNELDLVSDIMYDESNLSYRDIQREVAKWPYEGKFKALQAYINSRHSNKNPPERADYSWDITTSFNTFASFASHGIGRGLQWQLLTPRHGYKVPSVIEEASLTDSFEACFDISLEIYSQLQSAGYYQEAQYATLGGHKIRWKVSTSAADIFQLKKLLGSASEESGVTRLIQKMNVKLTEVHPIIFE